MLIVVCIKQVPDTTQVQIDPVTNTLVREGIPFIVNPYDTHALEEALRLKDRFGCRVAAISMGPPNAEATLRKALALGADRAILLSDRVFGGADTLATSNVLAAAISRLDSELEKVGIVLCGKQTIDGDTAQVGPGIASRLSLQQFDPGGQDSFNRAERRENSRKQKAGGAPRDSRIPASCHADRSPGA